MTQAWRSPDQANTGLYSRTYSPLPNWPSKQTSAVREPPSITLVHPATPGTPLAGLEERPNIWPNGRYLGSAATMPHEQGAMSELFVMDAERIRVLPEGLPLR